ncbi:MAG TPA: 30S ribosome-binding factor RbfA [bacterium]|nr:30S ribosome-binding factor RbfA [bacterium]
MQGKRTDRVGHLVQMELSQLILTRINDPRLGFMTVTHVDMTPDLKSATVFYSVLGDSKKRDDSQKALEHAAGFLQKSIATALKLRYTPKLRFQFDDSLDQGFEIDRLIRESKKDTL